MSSCHATHSLSQAISTLPITPMYLRMVYEPPPFPAILLQLPELSYVDLPRLYSLCVVRLLRYLWLFLLLLVVAIAAG